MTKILVVGSSGFIGQELTYKLYHAGYGVVGGINSQEMPSVPYKKVKIDILSRKSVEDAVTFEKPDIIVNLAAMSRIKECKEKPDLAYRLNVEGVEFLVDTAEKLEKKPLFVQFSTDHIFNGIDRKNGNYKENDKTIPSNYYGETKLDSEGVVKDSSLEYLIVRTSLNFGWYRYSNRQMDRLHFIVMKKLKERENYTVNPNTIISPTYLEYLCEGVLFLLEKNIRNETVHIAGKDALSKFEFATRIAKLFGGKSCEKRVMTLTNILNIKNTSLNTEKMLGLGYPQICIEESLKRFKKERSPMLN